MSKHFQFQNHGSIMQINCLTQDAKEWLKENVYYERWQVFGDSICIEPRMFNDIYEAIKREFL